MHTRISAKTVSVIGFLVAMEILLARFSIHTWNLKIGFSFVPVVVAAIVYGPAVSGPVFAIGDVMGAVLFPVGAYFPGFTLTAFLMGAAFGFFLNKKVTVASTVLAVLLVQGLLGCLLNTYWISLLYGSPYLPLVASRCYQALAMGIVQTVSILMIDKKLIPVLK